MTRRPAVALLLLGPLAAIILIALALFGTEGPADHDLRAQALFRLLGMVYGIYLVGLSFFWSRRRQRNERR
ncbi:MAG: hypothetical protein K2Y23_17750 [Cyanobacteria bacterium]|nr:hypothetical protein [Cyanobacteriota bacterium]